MPTIQISKIQLRRGLAADLPSPSLDDGELAFTTDLGRIFIGQNSPTLGQPNFNRVTFPFQNVEVFTENSPLGTLLQPVISDNQQGFIQAVPLSITGSPLNFQTYDSTNTAQDFHVNFAAGLGVNATFYYYIYDVSEDPIRMGKINILWNTNMAGPPLYSEESEVIFGNITDIQWTVALIGSMGNQYVVLKYVNLTSGTPTVYFRIDRPLTIVP